MMTTDDVFSKLNKDVLINIISELDLQDWGRLACVSKIFCSALHDFCYKIICTQTNPDLVSDLLRDPISSSPPSGWAAIFITELSCELGNELLNDQFDRNCLYITSWPSCVHIGGMHYYLLFRGIFINFKESMIWRALNNGDGNEYKVNLKCGFCSCKHTWDLYSSSCFKHFYLLNDDGDSVDRAFVCENGHVFGAWTMFDPEIPIYGGI
ncbi:hypothetical protein POM88_000249 [Heracleum sosnowskyi]|uniref:F-box domain-containing protein n=1 Tax=Heracleum sosnowskyi TaxID=360622 RepID=A0AAD8JAU8_9APIA|nr:hypothetical protein POM88_000249 [Heracleum sosnowskyi]